MNQNHQRAPDVQAIIDEADSSRNAGDHRRALALYQSIEARCVEDGSVQTMLALETFREMSRFLERGKAFEYRRLLSEIGQGLRDGKYDESTARWIREWLPKLPLTLR